MLAWCFLYWSRVIKEVFLKTIPRGLSLCLGLSSPAVQDLGYTSFFRITLTAIKRRLDRRLMSSMGYRCYLHKGIQETTSLVFLILYVFIVNLVHLFILVQVQCYLSSWRYSGTSLCLYGVSYLVLECTSSSLLRQDIVLSFIGLQEKK